MLRLPPRPPLFPYTTLFRSTQLVGVLVVGLAVAGVRFGPARRGVATRRRSPLEHLEALAAGLEGDRKSTRLNSSHEWISYAVFCLKKKSIPALTRPLLCCVT